jgi:NitT/TauT family transport system substrate-binding protein
MRKTMRNMTGQVGLSGILWGMMVLFTFVVCAASCSKQERPAEPKKKVTVGVASATLSAPVFIAYEKRFFSDEGLDVVLKLYPSGKKAMEGMFAGEVDLATVADTPIVLASFAREDYVILATFVHSYDDVKVLCRKDRGIIRPADLKGKRIGTSLMTSAHFFIHVYLVEHGIRKSEVNVIDVPPQELPEALRHGKVDAVAIFEPYAYQAEKALPGNVVRLPKSSLYRETFNLVAMKKFAMDNLEGLKRILKAVDRSIEFIHRNRKESISLLAGATAVNETLLVSVWSDFIYGLSLDRSLLTSMEDEARWAMRNRITEVKKIPNYLDYIYLDAMKAVRPESATIIK